MGQPMGNWRRLPEDVLRTEDDDDDEGADDDDDDDHDNEKKMKNSRNSHTVGQKKSGGTAHG